jgi:hypothetical protein
MLHPRTLTRLKAEQKNKRKAIMHILQNIAMFFGIMLFTAHEYLTAFILVTVILASVVGGISTLTGSTFWLGAQYTAMTCAGLGVIAAAGIAFSQVARGFR